MSKNFDEMKKVPKNIGIHQASIPVIPNGIYNAELFDNVIVIKCNSNRYAIRSNISNGIKHSETTLIVIDNKVYMKAISMSNEDVIQWAESSGIPFINGV